MPEPRISIQPVPLHRWQREPSRRKPASQLKQETSTSTLGSVNGKKCGGRRSSRSSPQSGRGGRARVEVAWRVLGDARGGEGEQRPLEIAERDVLVDGEPFDLVELRRVRRVV